MSDSRVMPFLRSKSYEVIICRDSYESDKREVLECLEGIKNDKDFYIGLLLDRAQKLKLSRQRYLDVKRDVKQFSSITGFRDFCDDIINDESLYSYR